MTLAILMNLGFGGGDVTVFVPTFSLRDTLQDLRSAILATGYVSDCDIGGPKQIGVSNKAHASITMDSVSVPEVSLGTTHDYFILRIRFYYDAFAEPDEIEIALADAVSQSWVNILADFDAGATIRNIDVAGQYGQSLSARWGHESVSGKMYRVADVVLPLIVNDVATLTQ